MKRTLRLLALACTCGGLLVASGCGDDETASSGKEAPESRIAPDAEVSAGLKTMVVVAKGISRVPDGAASKKASKALEPVWVKVEGTVKKNEPDMYATIEEDLSLLESGEQSKTNTGAAELAKTVHDYLAKYPG